MYEDVDVILLLDLSRDHEGSQTRIQLQDDCKWIELCRKVLQ